MSKEALVIVLDTGSGMGRSGANGHSHLSSGKTVVDLVLNAKMLHRKNDVVGIVEVGRSGGGNAFSYANVNVLAEMGAPTVELLQSVPTIAVDGVVGDVMDGVVVALDMIRAWCGTRKWAKRVMVITNGLTPINEFGIPKIADQIALLGAQLSVVGIGFEEFDDEEMAEPDFELRQKARTDKDPQLLHSEALFRDLCATVDSTFVNLKSALKAMSSFRSKTTLQRPTYTGTLDIGAVSIGVYGYTKTMEVRLPSATKSSTLAAGPPGSVAKVLRQLTYHLQDDDRTELEKDEICKGFRYGKSVVPFAAVDEDALKYKAPKALKALGFAAAKHVFRHHYMANITCFVPTPGSDESTTALHALIHALYETDHVIIVRYVARNNSAPRLGFCWPSVEADGLCLYYSHLPFMEDVRQYQFPSLARARAFVPTKDQLTAADALIDALDLSTALVDDDGDVCEALDPEFTFNPVLQYYYQALQHRALNPADPNLPPVDPRIAATVQPDPNLFARAAPATEAFAAAFPLVKVEASKKRTRRFWAAADDDDDDDAALAGPSSALPPSHATSSTSGPAASALLGAGPLAKRRKLGAGDDVSVDSLLAKQVDAVTSVNPVADFEAMCARRDADLVDVAIAQLSDVIVNLVDTSFRASYYPKAIDCLVALRAMSIKQDEPGPFNALLPRLRDSYQSGRKADWWALVVAAGITLISSDEADDSDVSPAAAAAFIAGAHAPPPVAPPPAPAAPDDDDDIFGMLE